MTERVLIISEEHLVMVMTEYYRRNRENPEDFQAPTDDDAEAGAACVEYVFELAKEMGYVQY